MLGFPIDAPIARYVGHASRLRIAYLADFLATVTKDFYPIGRSFDVSNYSEISKHYERGDLLDRLRAALTDDGVDPDHPTVETLAPFDHFHGRGLDATQELANALNVSATDHILDVGSGIGGPARFMADRFGCRVTGIDLTGEFCEVARSLSRVLGLEGRVCFEQGDALAMPFSSASFDGAYSMNVSMNIAHKDRFYDEIYRVLRPGAWLVLSRSLRGLMVARTTQRPGQRRRHRAFSYRYP